MTLAATAAHARRAEEGPAVDTAGAKREFGIVPIAGGNTDYGLGGGFLTNIAGLDAAVAPYTWRLEAAAFVSFKAKDAEPSEWVNPYQDYYFLLTVPHFLNERLRLELRPSYTRETTQLYYGLGNASVAPPDEIPGRDFYGRDASDAVHQVALGRRGRRLRRARRRLHRKLVPARPAEHARRRHERRRAPPCASCWARPPATACCSAEHALIYDTRDSEIAPEQGQYHQLKIRYSPALGRPPAVPVRSGQRDLPLLPCRSPHAVGLAIRAVGDWQFGDVPFYELARYEDTFAFGGVNGVRGIPGQRYYGRIKLFSNVELRARLLDFSRVPQAATPWAARCSRTSGGSGPTSARTPSWTGQGSGSSTGWEAGYASSRGRRS
jgi:hypothetical protein